MLDINDPRTKLIFKASSYMDKIKFGCQSYIHHEFEARQITFAEMKKICDELVIFSEEVFKDRIDGIRNTVQKIKDEIDRLSLINIVADDDKCQVCNSEIKRFKSYFKEFPDTTICTDCPTTIYKYLLELEGPTETMWI